MPTTTTVDSGRSLRRQGVGDAGRIRKAGNRRGGRDPALPYRVGQGDQIVVVGMNRQRRGVANQLPAPRSGDPTGVTEA